jgi:hypothetical protein
MVSCVAWHAWVMTRLQGPSISLPAYHSHIWLSTWWYMIILCASEVVGKLPHVFMHVYEHTNTWSLLIFEVWNVCIFYGKYHFTLNQDRVLKKYQLVKPFEIRIPTRQEWQMPDKIIDPNVDLRFTSGSGIRDCFGTGIFGPLCNYRESIPMGSLSTVFSGEVMAILRWSELLLTNQYERGNTHLLWQYSICRGTGENYYQIILGLGMYASAGKTKWIQQSHFSVDLWASRNTGQQEGRQTG